MAPQLQPGEDVAGALRRIAHKDLRAAVIDLRDRAGAQPGEVVREVYGRCERALSLLHLAAADADADPAVHETIALLNRSCDLLAPVRNAHVLLDALDDLDAPGSTVVRTTVAERVAALDTQLVPGCVIADAVAALLDEADAEVETVDLDGDGWAALEPALRRTYDEARRAAGSDTTEWHRRTRELAHQLHFAGLPADEVDELDDVLTEERELALLGDDLGSRAPVAVAAMAAARRDELRRRALGLAATVYAATPVEWIASFRRGATGEAAPASASSTTG